MSPESNDFPTCLETYASLRVFSDTLQPNQVSARLGLVPSRAFAKGDPYGRGRVRRHGGWILSSRNAVESSDTRHHIDWLLDQLDGKSKELDALRDLGCEVDVSCIWVSAQGQGGPILSPSQMKRLAEHGLDIWWDVYFDQSANVSQSPDRQS